MKKIKNIIREMISPKDRFQKVYTGNIFNRLQGLEPVLKESKGLTILDIGSAEGLIDYEFAKNGCSLIHGFERDSKRVQFSKLLFQEVPVESGFYKANLSQKHETFDKKFNNILLEKYDIVLYLGVYHHLIKQANTIDVHDFIKYLLSKTKIFFVVRTNMIPSFERLILDNNFIVFSEAPLNDIVGKLKIYKRI